MSLGDDIGSLYRAIENFSVPHGATSQDLLNSAQALMEIDKRIESLRGRSIPGTEGSRQYELMRQRCGNAKNKLIAEVDHAKGTASLMDAQLMDAALSKLVTGGSRQGVNKRKAEENDDEVGVRKQKHSPSRLPVVHQDVRNLVASIEAVLQDPSIDIPRLESVLQEIEVCRRRMEALQGDATNFDQLQAARDAVLSVREDLLYSHAGRLIAKILEPGEAWVDDLAPQVVWTELVRLEQQLQEVRGGRDIIGAIQRVKGIVVSRGQMMVSHLRGGIQQITERIYDGDKVKPLSNKDREKELKKIDQVEKVLDGLVVPVEVFDAGVRGRLMMMRQDLVASSGTEVENVRARIKIAMSRLSLMDMETVQVPEHQGLPELSPMDMETVQVPKHQGLPELSPMDMETVQVQVRQELLNEVHDDLEQVQKREVVDFRLENGLTPLTVASAHGSVEQVQELLRKGADVNYSSEDGTTPLMGAVQYGTVDTVRALLDAKANVQLLDKAGKSALKIAVDAGRVDVVQLLLEAKADPNFVDADGEPLLVCAVCKGDLALVQCLLDAKANVHERGSYKQTALIIAVYKADINIVAALLKAGAHVDDKEGESERTALMFALGHGHTGMANLLIDNGANVHLCDRKQVSTLMLAAVSGNPEVVELMLQRGVNIDLMEAGGRTALLFAVEKGHKEIVRLLLRAGADPNIGSQIGVSTFVVAILVSKGVEIVELLIKSKKIDVNKIDFRGGTPLLSATMRGDIDKVKLLLDNGADPNIALPKGNSPLVMARLQLPPDKYEAIKALLSADSTLAAEYKKIVIRARTIANASSMAAKSFKYKDASGKEVSISVEGLVNSNYFAKVMEKNWEKYTQENPNVFPSYIVQRITDALKLSQKSFCIPEEELVKEYNAGNPVLISTGFSDHQVIMVLSDGYVLLANRGSCSRAPLEVFHFVNGAEKTAGFLSRYISTFHKLRGATQDRYVAAIEKEFSEPCYEQNNLEREIGIGLGLGMQTVGNCPWASLEQALVGLMALEVMKDKASRNEPFLKEDIVEVRKKFDDFAAYQINVVLEKQKKLPEGQWV